MGKLISVPVDSNRFCRPEICFDEYRPGGAEFAIKCAPTKAATRRARRFVVGDRVSVAVEDDTDAFSDWAAGVVLSVDHAVFWQNTRLEFYVTNGGSFYSVNLQRSTPLMGPRQHGHLSGCPRASAASDARATQW